MQKNPSLLARIAAIARSQYVDIALILIITLLAWETAIKIFVSLSWSMVLDAPIFHFIAYRLLAGDVPYRDIFDINTPGIYVLHMLHIALFGVGDFAFRLFDLFWLFLSAGLLAALLWRQSRAVAIMVALLWMRYHIGLNVQVTGERDFVMVAFLLASCFLLLRALATPHCRLFILSGLLAGFAATIKPTALLFILLPLPFIRRQPLKYLAAYAVAFAIPSLCFAAWIIAIGAAPAFMEMMTQFHPAYRTNYRDMLTQWLFYWPLLGFACAIILRSRFRSEPYSSIAVAGFAFSFIHVVAQQKGWAYHLYPLAAFALLTAGFMLAGFKRTLPAPVTCVSIIAIVATIQSWPYNNFPLFSGLYNVDTPASDAYLANVQKEVEDAVHMLPQPVQAEFNAASEKPILFCTGTRGGGDLWKAAYRFHWKQQHRNTYSFVMKPYIHTPMRDRLFKEFARDISRKKPPLLIISDACGDYTGLMEKNRQLAPYMRKHYKLAKQSGFYYILARVN